MTIVIQGAARVQARLARLPETIARTAQQTVARLGTAYLATLIDETPVGSGPAGGRRLYQRYETTEQQDANGATYHITNDSPSLSYVLHGRGPVTARSGRALRFEIYGKVFFRRSVGPAAANDFPSRARARMQGPIDAARAALPGLIVEEYHR